MLVWSLLRFPTYGSGKVGKAGDTAYYNSVVRHGLRALNGQPASIYGVVFKDELPKTVSGKIQRNLL